MGKKSSYGTSTEDTPSDFFSDSSIDTADFSHFNKASTKATESGRKGHKSGTVSHTVHSEEYNHHSLLDSIPATINGSGFAAPTAASPAPAPVAPAPSPAPVANPNPMLCCPTMLGFGWNPMNGGFSLNYNRCPPKPKKITVIRNRPGCYPPSYPLCSPGCQPYCSPASCGYPSYQSCYPCYNPQPTVMIDPNIPSPVGNKTNYTFFRQTQLAPDLSPEMSGMINRVLQAVAFDQNKDSPPRRPLEGNNRHFPHHERRSHDQHSYPKHSHRTSDETLSDHHHHQKKSHHTNKDKHGSPSRNKGKHGNPSRNKEKNGHIRTFSTSHTEESSTDITLSSRSEVSKSKDEKGQKWHIKTFDYTKDIYREPEKVNKTRDKIKEENRRKSKDEDYKRKKFAENRKDFERKLQNSKDDKRKDISNGPNKVNDSSGGKEKVKQIARGSAGSLGPEEVQAKRRNSNQPPRRTSGDRRKSDETQRRTSGDRRKLDESQRRPSRDRRNPDESQRGDSGERRKSNQSRRQSPKKRSTSNSTVVFDLK